MTQHVLSSSSIYILRFKNTSNLVSYNATIRNLPYIHHEYNYYHFYHIVCLQDMIDTAEGVSYEVDPARMETGEVLEDNQQNLAQITQRVFNAIVSSADRFPPQLRSMCHCLYQVLCKRFPQSIQNNLLRKIESCKYGVWQVKCYLARCLGVLLIAACCRRSRTLL